jgi:protein-S-isoprenylcysteine O-methyltransferase Ste14
LPILIYSSSSGGPGLLLGGGAVVVQSLAALGSDSLSPFPAPPRTGALKTDGIYGQMRHPMYTGLIMVMSGLSIFTDSADRLLLTALLAYLVEIKSNKEEAYLLESYGQAYNDYMEQVPEKFLPTFLMEAMPWNKNHY